MPTGQVYIAITGLQLKCLAYWPLFGWLAMRAMAQAKAAPGLLRAEGRKINGVYHTLSVWQDKNAMLAFMTTGSHRHAMRYFPRIATGKTVGFYAAHVPAWSEVHGLYQAQGIACRP